MFNYTIKMYQNTIYNNDYEDTYLYPVVDFSVTSYYTTMEAPPSRAPINVTGGGGKVGNLIMRWDVSRLYQ